MMMTKLIGRIDRLIKKTGIMPSVLSRRMMRDPAFIRQLRQGRCLRPATEARVEAWLDEAERALEGGRWEG